MSRYDAERALEIYKTFTKQTSDVFEYLQTARRLETSTRLQIPKLKHAPTSLTQSLEEYLHDPDFDINRREYLAAQEAKKNGGKTTNTVVAKKAGTEKTENSNAKEASSVEPKLPTAAPPTSVQQQQPKVAPDLIDFFDSIEPVVDLQQTQQQQVVMAQSFYSQPNLVQPSFFQPQQQPFTSLATNFGTYPSFNTSNFVPTTDTTVSGQQPALHPVRTDFTGHGFGGYTPQDQNSVTVPSMPQMPQPFQSQAFQSPIAQQPFQHTAVQQQFQVQLQQTPSASLSIPASQGTNPFRQSMMADTSFTSSPPQPKSTNPFTRTASIQKSLGGSDLVSYTTGPGPSSPYGTSQSVQQPLRSVQTGTNPFARSFTASQAPPVPSITNATGHSSPSTLSAHTTGVTNPFRASMMQQKQQQQQQQQQQQNGQPAGTIPGWENIETIPVFPRTN